MMYEPSSFWAALISQGLSKCCSWRCVWGEDVWSADTDWDGCYSRELCHYDWGFGAVIGMNRMEWMDLLTCLFPLELKVKRIPVLICSIQSLFYKYNIIRYSYPVQYNLRWTFWIMAVDSCLSYQLPSLHWQYHPQVFENSSFFTFWAPSTIPPMFGLE